MTQATGQQSQLVIGKETTFDTAATSGFVVPINSSNVSGGRNKTTPQTIRDNRNPAQPFDGNYTVSGDIIVPVDSIALWYWLQLMFGDPSTSGTDPYDHVFTVPSSQPSFTMEHAHTDISDYTRFTGCKISRWSMSVGGDGELISTFGVIGATPSLESTSFDGSATSVSFSRLSNMHASLDEGGSDITNATDVSLNVDFATDGDNHTIGDGGTLGDIPVGIISVTGSLTTLFEDQTLLTKAINSTESSLTLSVSAAASSALEIEIPELQYELATPPIDGPAGLMVNLNFVAYYDDDADASSIIATLTNSEAHA